MLDDVFQITRLPVKGKALVNKSKKDKTTVKYSPRFRMLGGVRLLKNLLGVGARGFSFHFLGRPSQRLKSGEQIHR